MEPFDERGPDPICIDDVYPRYTPGIYDVRCTRAVIYADPRFRAKGKDGITRPTWKCRLDCQFLDDRASVSAFFNLGNEEHPYIGRGSRYWKTWVMANGSSPGKRQRTKKQVFVSKFFRVAIGDTQKDKNGAAHPEGAIYSTIKEFVACLGP